MGLIVSQVTASEVYAQVAMFVITSLLATVVIWMWGIKQKLNELHDVHLGPNALDEDRSPKWYIRKPLEENMAELSTAIAGLTKVMEAVHSSQQKTEEVLREATNHFKSRAEMESEIDELRKEVSSMRRHFRDKKDKD
jgi:chromosome segregation ATPase